MKTSCKRLGGTLRVLVWAGAGILFALWPENCLAQEPVAPLSAEQVVAEMTKRNLKRAEDLRGYSSVRTYECDYHGFGDRHAVLTVKMSYTSPDKKQFAITSESGSGILLKHVLRKLLEAEKEATSEENRRATAIQAENYEFRLLKFEQNADGAFYVLGLTPKKVSKFLFRGRVWVDARDFAVARMEGEPAKNPSWWTKSISIDVRYRKVGGFWLLASNHTLTQVRFHGHAVTTIDYGDYQLDCNGDSPVAGELPASGTKPSCTAGAPGGTSLRDR